MKLFNRLSLIAVLGLASFGAASAQVVTLLQTSSTSAVSSSVQNFPLASTSGITAGMDIYMDVELMNVLSVTGNFVMVQRGMSPTRSSTHAAGEMVLAGPPAAFFTVPAVGSCTLSQTYATPYVQVTNGAQWLCSSLTGIWAPGWNNVLEPTTTSAAVASAAGLVTPSGPFFHITGTAAITGFNIPLGFAYGSFTVIPDGAFTTTTATNIAAASTAVVGKALTFTYDTNTSKFYPSY